MLRHWVIVGWLATALVGCTTVVERPNAPLGHATLRFADGSPAGTARLIGQGDRVDIAVALQGMPEGRHGLHLHGIGDCAGQDFTSAGSHLDPGSRQHGRENPDGAHLGELPNAIVNASGAANVSATLDGARAQLLAHIFDTDGTAIVVHQRPDDYRTDPSGNSGGRIACGVFSAG